jgi:hypothetical protein
MSATITTTTRTSAATYTRPSTEAEILADALARIISGRPLPEALRPTTYVAAPVASVQDGIARILRAPR